MPITVSLVRPDAGSLATPLLVVALGADRPLPPSLAAVDATLGGGRAPHKQELYIINIK
jgi:hypothetical protein